MEEEFNNISTPPEIKNMYLPSLNEEQVRIARDLVRKQNPLRHEPMEAVLPYLCCCLKFCRKTINKDQFQKLLESKTEDIEYDIDDEQLLLEAQTLDQKLEDIIRDCGGEPYVGDNLLEFKRLQMKKSILKRSRDTTQQQLKFGEEDQSGIFSEYGTGIESYFKFLKTLIKIYLALCVLICPVLYLYQRDDGLNGLKHQWITKFTLGNLGFAESLCYNQLNDKGKGKKELRCRTGVLQPEVIFQGLLQHEKITNTTGHEIHHDYCGDSTKIAEKDQCEYDSEGLKQEYREKCAGKINCTLDLQDFTILGQTNENCNKQSSIAYVQVQCKQPDKQIKDKQLFAIFVVCIFTIASRLFIYSIQYLERISVIDFKKWDFENKTVSDFSIQIQITKIMWRFFQQRRQMDQDTLPIDQYITQEIEKKVKSLPQVLQDNEHNEIKVACISFAYRNGEIIKLLDKRGDILGQGKFAEASNQDQKILKLLEDKMGQITTPVSAFVTFTTQEAFERCNKHLFKYNEVGYKNKDFQSTAILGQPTIINEAPEPSNIIWENLGITGNWLLFNSIKANIVMFILVMAGFMFFWFLKYMPNEYMQRYPETTHCNALQNVYGVNNKTFEDLSLKQKQDNEMYKAFFESAKNDKDRTLRKHGLGYYQCFCEKFESEFSQYHSNSNDGIGNLCHDYHVQNEGMKAVGFTTSFLIVTFNIVIRTFNIFIIDKIGYDRKSQVTIQVMKKVLMASFLNTGMLLLLVNANFEYAPGPLKLIPLRGMYNDFDIYWYSHNSKALCQTMMITAVYPWIELAIFGGLRQLKRIFDSKQLPCCRKSLQTKCTTQKQYVDLYSGPQYLMHFKYSSIIMQVAISFMYGMMIPILFPIALFGLINMYVNEKLLLAYYYRQPPMYDMELHLNALKEIKLAPILMFLMGYWAMGNTQMFENALLPKEYDTIEADPQHKLFSDRWNATWMCLYPLIGTVLGQYGISLVTKCLEKYSSFFTTPWKDLNFDENLGQFWSNLSALDQKLWYTTEVYQRNKLQIKTLSDESLEILRTETSNKNNVIKTISNYEILNNIFYADKLGFQSLDLRYNQLDNDLCDMITRTIYTNPHNQTVPCDDIMKLISKHMNLNLMLKANSHQSTMDDFFAHMKDHRQDGRMTHKQYKEYEMVKRSHTELGTSKDNFEKVGIN